MTTGDIPDWILDNPVEWQATEAFLPVIVEVGPTWDYNRRSGIWYAALTVDLPETIFDACDHDHPTKDEAWECGHAQVRQLAEDLAGRGYFT